MKTHQDCEEIKRLRLFIKERGWSYERMARNMDISSRTIYLWLNNKTEPSSLGKRAIRHFLLTIF